MKKNDYRKPTVTIIAISTETPFMQNSGDSTTDIDIGGARPVTPPDADSKQNDTWDNNVWDSKW